MTIQEIYDLALEMGIGADPRGVDGVKKLLARTKKEYEEMPEKKKKFFDKESLKNPYSDSRILFGDSKIKVGKLMVGIDADATEVLLADRLNQPRLDRGQKGEKVDLVISHHPSGHALASLHEVMDILIDVFAQAGVPENIAHALLEERKGVVERRFGVLNHSQAVDTARLLNIPLLALHTIWDNLGDQFLRKHLGKKKFDTLGELLDYIKEIPEFTEAIKGKNPPLIVSGNEKSRVGKVFVSFSGGTAPSKELHVELAKAGVGTVVEMHVTEESIEELKKRRVNIISASHMAADSIGANIFLDELESRGIKVIPCSGLIRVKRLKNLKW